MGVRLTVQDSELVEEMYRRIMNDEAWCHSRSSTINAKALRMEALPDHLNAARFGEYEPHEMRLLADAIDLQARINDDIRSHDRYDQLVDIVEWLRYWADQDESVRGG